MKIGGGTWQRQREKELEAFMRHLRRESTRTLDDEREPRDGDMLYARWRHQQPRAARPVGEK